MGYFKAFPQIDYNFGDETYTTRFQNLSVYIDLLDRLKEDSSFYELYTILEGDRPDVLSHKLYGTSNFYWTFFFINDNLREFGWPKTSSRLHEYLINKYNDTIITSRDPLYDENIKVGDEIIGSTSGTITTIKNKILDLGQILVEGQHAFQAGETIHLNDSNQTPLFNVYSYSEQYNSPIYYTRDNERVDIDPYVGPGAELREVTFLDYYAEKNEENREIKILKEDVVKQIFLAYQRELSTNG